MLLNEVGMSENILGIVGILATLAWTAFIVRREDNDDGR